MIAVLPFAGTAQAEAPGSHFVENWDLDGDGKVTQAELTEKRGEVFYMFDENEDGQLDSAEYDLFDETRKADMEANAGGHPKGGKKGPQVGMKRDFNDTDGDGKVSRAEFLGQVGAWLAMLDRNGDGVVTTADFGPQGG